MGGIGNHVLSGGDGQDRLSGKAGTTSCLATQETYAPVARLTRAEMGRLTGIQEATSNAREIARFDAELPAQSFPNRSQDGLFNRS